MKVKSRISTSKTINRYKHKKVKGLQNKCSFIKLPAAVVVKHLPEFVFCFRDSSGLTRYIRMFPNPEHKLTYLGADI